MNKSKRIFLTHAGILSALAGLSEVGFISAALAKSSVWNKVAFEADNLLEAIGALTSQPVIEDSAGT